MRKVLAILIFVLCFVDQLSSQEIEKGYVILTFEINRHQGSHGNFIYHWIVPIDSICEKSELKIFPVYMDNFYATNDLNNCCSQVDIDIFTMTTASKYDYSEKYANQLDTLNLLVLKNRKLLQKISNKWTNGTKEDIQVWGTPIMGQFCSCGLIGDSKSDIDYKGIIFLPKSTFRNRHLINKHFIGIWGCPHHSH